MVEIFIPRVSPGLQGPPAAALSPDRSRLLTASSGAAKIDSANLFDLGARERTFTVPYQDADAAREIALNRSIWKSIKGRASAMPAPPHVHIIGSRPFDEDDG